MVAVNANGGSQCRPMGNAGFDFGNGRGSVAVNAMDTAEPDSHRRRRVRYRPGTSTDPGIRDSTGTWTPPNQEPETPPESDDEVMA